MKDKSKKCCKDEKEVVEKKIKTTQKGKQNFEKVEDKEKQFNENQDNDEQ